MRETVTKQTSDPGEFSADSLALPGYDHQKTLFTCFINAVRKYRDNEAYVYRAGDEEHRVSYAKVFEDVLLLSRAFQKRGISRGDKVMVLSDNRYAWIVTDLALMSFGAVNVPRGADTPTQELEFIVEHAKATFLIVETQQLLERHRAFVDDCGQLQAIFVMASSHRHSMFSNLYSYGDLLSDRRYKDKDRERFLRDGETLAEDDLLTIIYTSGTTGMPKGVMLTHGNVMHNIRVIPDIIGLTENDSWLSILPSWHIFERTAEYVALACGTCLVYSSVRTFAQDLVHYRPTLVATVPRVWESIYTKVEHGLQKKGAFTHRLFSILVWVSAAYRLNNRRWRGHLPVFRPPATGRKIATRLYAAVKITLLYPWYRLATVKLAPVKQRFGGRLRLAISGGGTLAPHLEQWLDGVGLRIVNAYGMTECAPAIAGRGLNCPVFGTLGPPVPETDLRIVGDDGLQLPPGEEGLIEVHGPQVTPGYYRNKEENHQAFTADGYFRTGDLGKLTVTGELVLTGRAKEIIVLSSGENIDPTKIENAMTMFPFIEDAVLVGQDKKGLGALLVPNIDELKTYMAKKIVDFRKDSEGLLTDNRVLDQIRNDINRILRPKQGFKPYEKLQGIIFLDGEFKLGEELTNTLKKKRHVIEKKYHQLINDLLR